MRYRVLFAFALAACACPASQAEDSSFGTACGTKLVVGCQPFHFTGANCHYLMTHAADEGSRSHADEVLAAAHSMGITCIRTWAFGEKGTWNVLQPSPGDYDYHVFEGLDYVLDRCGQLGIRVILTLVNSCDDYGGMQQYVDWDGGGAHDDFYTRPNCKEWYRNHVLKVLTRVNSVNGRTYKDDPTILAWELANEARARTAGLAVLNAWMQEMSGYIKSIDSNHLVSSGIEGFYADAQKNPTPVVVRVKREAVLPNYASLDVRECFVMAAGYGQLSSERALMRAETLSCVRQDGNVIETSLDAYIVGTDGKVGIPGRLVSKQGQMIAQTLVAGTLGGMDALLSVAQMPPGVPVGAVGIAAARNAALFAARIIALFDEAVHEKVWEDSAAAKLKVVESREEIRDLPSPPSSAFREV